MTPGPARPGERRDGGTDPTPEVLVVGAGPVGLTAAIELARRGVAVRLVDAAAGPATTSRALAVHARTLEVFDHLGITDRALTLGRRVEHFTIHQRGRVLCRFDTNYDTLPTPYPFSLMLDQVVTERLLRERLAGLGVHPEWGVRLESLSQGERCVAARLRSARGDEDVVVPWLVGADGSRSAVRSQLGLTLVGDSSERWLNVDIELDVDLPRDSNHLVQLGAAGSLLLVPFPEDGKWRVVDTVDHENADDLELVRSRIEAKLRRGLGVDLVASTPTWSSAFAVQQRMITSMRKGRCLVAGDAAHVHSPASGQGMNTGIQDAFNLGWKLAAVVRGQAADALLDTYSEERVPIGEALLGSTRKATALVALRNTFAPALMPIGLGLLRRIRPLKRKVESKIIRGFCGLGLCYISSPLALEAMRFPGEPDATPRPGMRVGRSLEASSAPGWVAMRHELTDPRWTLLLGPALNTEDDTATDRVARRYLQSVSTRRLILTGDAPGPRPVERIDDRAVTDLVDTGQVVASDLDVVAGSYLLVRPDGYVAARGATAEVEQALAAVHLIVEPALAAA